MKDLQIFNFKDNEVRTINDENGEVWFIANDVCKALELSNASEALSRLDDDEKGISTVDTPGGHQEMLIVNECGLYNLIFSSRKKEAKTFKRWVTHEVLPAIRKTGSYTLEKPEFEVATSFQEYRKDANAYLESDEHFKFIGIDPEEGRRIHKERGYIN